MGILFAIMVAIFTNYPSIERTVNMSREFGRVEIHPLLFSLVWYSMASLIYFLCTLKILTLLEGRNRISILVVLVVCSVVMAYVMSEFQSVVRDLITPEDDDMRRLRRSVMGGGMHGPTIALFNQLLVMVLNILFVYVLRLLYINHDIARRNEQLQLETMKSQHTALVQQINPHFFFNSLNSLRYIILKQQTDSAVDYLDNLTTIFRVTMKARGVVLHTMAQELELTHSYVHIIESRFEGKFSVDIDIDNSYQDFKVAPLALLTLIENVVKHNTIGSKSPIRAKVSIEKHNIVVVNNIVPKFEAVESSGIGLQNLNQQYELLCSRGITIYKEGGIFRVSLPLIN